MPAAAVIPAPIAYIKVVAVKKLVVEFWARLGGPARKGGHCVRSGPSFWGAGVHFTVCVGDPGLLL